jgi:hypothetical protein
MHDKPKSGEDSSWSAAEKDRHDQRAVLLHVVTTYPTHLRLSDLIREVGGGGEDFAERDRIERAVRDLIAVGLLFRCEGLVLPTRATLRSYEVL